MKILNLYAGIGGNRKLWAGHDITAVEINSDIASVYKQLYPFDLIIVDDAHDYLLHNYHKFDFIWSSPPCQSHSQMRQNMCVKRNQSPAAYADMRLYQEIIFLKHNFLGRWCVENVKPYYVPLIKPSVELERHFFWTNFTINIVNNKKLDFMSKNLIKRGTIVDFEHCYNIGLSRFNVKNKRRILRNCVNPEIGLYILEEALK